MDKGIITRFENILKLIGAGAGLIYALGFLLINVYFAEFGVREVRLLSAQFISAGIILLVILISPIWIFLVTILFYGVKNYQFIVDDRRRYEASIKAKIDELENSTDRKIWAGLRLRAWRQIYTVGIRLLEFLGILVVAEFSTRTMMALLASLGGISGLYSLGLLDVFHPFNLLSYLGTISWFIYYYRIWEPANPLPENLVPLGLISMGGDQKFRVFVQAELPDEDKENAECEVEERGDEKIETEKPNIMYGQRIRWNGIGMRSWFTYL